MIRGSTLVKIPQRLISSSTYRLGGMEKVKEVTKNAADALKEDGSVGSKFTPQGSIGSIGEKVGGPFSSDGAIGTVSDLFCSMIRSIYQKKSIVQISNSPRTE